MVGYLRTVVRHVDNQTGAEIAEWVLWVGGIALIAGTIYSLVSTQLGNTAVNIISGLTVPSGS